MRFVFLLFCCSLCIASYSQSSEIKTDSVKVHSAKKASILSAIIPGAGQIYNHLAMPKGSKKAYWKVPLIYAGLGLTTYYLIQNQAIQSDLIANVASLYYQLLAIDAQIVVVTNRINNRNQSVAVIKALKDAGNVNEVAVKQTEAQKYATEIILKDLVYNRKIIENSF